MNENYALVATCQLVYPHFKDAANHRPPEPNRSFTNREETTMPFVRINLSQDTTPETARTISDVVYESMTAVASVPPHDKFQVITRHAPDELVYPAEGYLGVHYTPNIVFIQVTWNTGRTTEVKKAFYRAVADGIHARAGLRKEDVWINLVDVNREDWSFGNGDMQYAPK
jgi:4-oxalocrotonate tautomerase